MCWAIYFSWISMGLFHRHLRNIDCLMAHNACLVCFISSVNGHSKKSKKRSLLWVALEAGTQQNLSSLYYLDVYGLLLSFAYFFGWVRLHQSDCSEAIFSKLIKWDKKIKQCFSNSGFKMHFLATRWQGRISKWEENSLNIYFPNES